jgi:PAS domain S-box-containing protein
MYYGGPESAEGGPLRGIHVNMLLPWLEPELTNFFERDREKTVFEKSLNSGGEGVHYQVSLSRMLDVSGKYTGVVVDLKDITLRKEYEAALIREKEISRMYLVLIRK